MRNDMNIRAAKALAWITLVFTGPLLTAGSVGAAEKLEQDKPLENGHSLEDKKNSFQSLEEVSGLIVDRTMTRLGDDFYSFFSQKMNDRYDDLKENLEVRERPTALSGSIIGVYHSGKPIYRTALSPGRRQAQEKADEAVRAVGDYIVRWQAERLFQDTFDLDHDEF